VKVQVAVTRPVGVFLFPERVKFEVVPSYAHVGFPPPTVVTHESVYPAGIVTLGAPVQRTFMEFEFPLETATAGVAVAGKEGSDVPAADVAVTVTV
jgi:hypothetical protein